jgi:hypothetical protein
VTPFRRQVPKLSVAFAGNQPNPDQLKIQLKRPPAKPTEEELSAIVKEVEARLLQKIPVADTEGLKGHWSREIVERFSISPERITQYEEAIPKYLRGYPQYLEGDDKYQERLARTIRLDFALVNSGCVPAEYPVILMHFPDRFVLTEKKPQPYKIPDPPKLPRNSTEEEWETDPPSSRLRLAGNYRGRNIVPTEPNVSTPTITKVERYHVRLEVRKIKPSREILLDPLWVIFPDFDSAGSFEITYSILARNCPDPFGGVLHIGIERKS